MELAIPTALAMKGRLTLFLFDAELAPRYELARLARERGQIIQRATADNLLVTGGLNLLTLAVNWAFVQNDNVGFGGPFSSTSGNLGELYGAVGTGATAVAASQVSLVTESARVIITGASASANSITYDFFFGTGSGNVTIAEVGCFMQASATLNSGTMLDRTVISPAVAKTSVNTAILELQLTLTSG